MAGYFSVTIAGDEVEKGKSDPEIYFKACNQLGAKPERCVAIEDSPAGISAAIQAGLVTIAVLRHPEDRAALIEADLLVRSLADVTIKDLTECLV